jgi:hypothetical protein
MNSSARSFSLAVDGKEALGRGRDQLVSLGKADPGEVARDAPAAKRVGQGGASDRGQARAQGMVHLVDIAGGDRGADPIDRPAVTQVIELNF